MSVLRWPTSPTGPTATGCSSSSAAGRPNQEGETRERAVREGWRRPRRPDAASCGKPGDGGLRRAALAEDGGLRFQAAARTAGVEHVTAHSGRGGLASELTSRGASTTDVMLAGNWKTSRMVAHYSADATAERGAVARYLLSSQGMRYHSVAK